MPNEPKGDQPPKKGSQKRGRAAKPEDIPGVLEEVNDWKEFATFIVRFERRAADDKEEKRTTIEHHETGEQAKPPWPGIETTEVCEWMLQRLGEKAEISSDEVEPKIEPPTPSGIPALESVDLEITGIQVFQPPSSDQPQELLGLDRAFNGYVKGGEPLSFVVSFQLTGVGASEATKRKLEFGSVFHAVELYTSAVTRLGASTPAQLRPNQSSYQALLSPLTLSPGVYKLKIVTTVRDVRPFWAYNEIAYFQVM
jgi:hypothetical protein